MKRNLFLSAILPALLFSFSGHAQSFREPENYKDSLSCAVANDLINLLDDFSPQDIDIELLAKTLIQGYRDTSVRWDEETRHRIISRYFQEILPSRFAERERQYLDSIRQNIPGINISPSGLLYKIQTTGDTTLKIGPEDIFIVDYTTRLPDGTIVDSSIERGQPLSSSPSQVIQGFGEGVMLIGKGGKIQLWIPQQLAYGAQGAGSVIPPYTPLFIEIELKDLVKTGVDPDDIG